MQKFYIAILALIIGLIAAWVNPLLALAVIFGLVVLIFLARNLDFGLIILVFFFPYLGLVIDFGAFESLREVPYLKNVNAPFVDLFGLVLLVAWGIVVIFQYFRGSTPTLSVRRTLSVANNGANNPSTLSDVHCGAQHSVLLRLRMGMGRIFPFWKSYALFWASGLVSFLKVPSVYFWSSFKYLARPFTFFYLVFFAMPVSILTQSIHNPPHPSLTLREGDRSVPPLRVRGGEEGLLYRVLLVFYATGLLSAINGLLGLIFANHLDFPRATPFGFFGLSPLGPNHNLLAETLIATAPVGLLLNRTTLSVPVTLSVDADVQVAAQHSVLRRKWIIWGMFFQWGIALLTFARTAWIAIAVQAIVYIYFTHRGRVHKFIKDSAPVIILLAVLAVMFGLTTFSETVRGSTLTRLDMARITEFYFERTPWTGQGLGTFIPTLWQTKVFLLEYGEPLEAHGIVFKLMFEQGLLGMIAFAILAGAILRYLYRAYKIESSASSYGTACLVALMIASGSLAYQLFNTTYYTSKLWIPLAIAVAITKIYEYSNTHTKVVS